MNRPDEGPYVLEKYRPYLHLLVRLEIGPELQGKLDGSGVVQQTLMRAHQDYEQFRGRDEAQIRAWLRQILAHDLTDEVRKLKARKRDVRRERSIQAALEESSCRLEAWLTSSQMSPSQAAIRQEQVVQLAELLDGLPEDQRTAIELHHLKGVPLTEVAAALGRSKGAVAQLVYRGLKQMRAQAEDADRSAS